MEIPAPWVHGARWLTADEKKHSFTCRVCASSELARGMLTHAPDRIQLWRPVPACGACLARPRGWPTQRDPNLKGDARGTLGHTVFAVAVDDKPEDFGAFTTLPLSQNERHRGMFFDGDVARHLRGLGNPVNGQPSREPPMYNGVAAETPTSHWISWDMVNRIDGRELLERYKALQAEILGKVLAEHDGSWERFNARAGKSIVFHLPPDMRYKGSAQLVNAEKRSRALHGRPASGPLLRKEFGRYFLDNASRSSRPYLVCASGKGDMFVPGAQLFWDYGCDHAREEKQQRQALPRGPFAPFSSLPSQVPRKSHVHKSTRFLPGLAPSLYWDIRTLAEICGTSKIVLVHFEENGLEEFSPAELAQVSCCDLKFFETPRTDQARNELFDNSFLCLLCMPGQYFQRMVDEFEIFAFRCADEEKTKLAGLGLASGRNFGLALDIWKQSRVFRHKSAFCRIYGQALCWQITYSDGAEKKISTLKATRGGPRDSYTKAYKRIAEAFKHKIHPLVNICEHFDPDRRRQQYTIWINEQKGWYDHSARSGTIVSCDQFFYVVFWRPFNFALVARRKIKSSDNLVIAEFPAILDKRTRKPVLDDPREDDEQATSRRSRRRPPRGKQEKARKPDDGEGGQVSMSGVGKRLAELWPREQDTRMWGWNRKDEYFVPHYRQPNLTGAPHAGIVGAGKPIPTSLLAHCALGTTVDKYVNARIAVDETNRFYLQAIEGRDFEEHDLVLVDYDWDAEETADFVTLRQGSFRAELAKDGPMQELVTQQLREIDALPGPGRQALLEIEGELDIRKKNKARKPRTNPGRLRAPPPVGTNQEEERSGAAAPVRELISAETEQQRL